MHMLELDEADFFLELALFRIQCSPMLMLSPLYNCIQAAVATVVHEDDLVLDIRFEVREILLPVECPPFHPLLYDPLHIQLTFSDEVQRCLQGSRTIYFC